MKPIVVYIGDQEKGRDRLASHAASIQPSLEKLENGFYILRSIGSKWEGPFRTEQEGNNNI